MKLAYITGHYARASDTFIRSEVIGLRSLGHVVRTFSVRREASAKDLSDEVRSEQASTTYILEQPKSAILAAVIWCWLTRPRGLWKAASLAWRTRVPGVRGTLMQVIYVVEACFLARALVREEIEIIHNHIAENSATVTMLASTICGVPYSMTVHGPGIFFHPRQWALGEKIARAAFTASITEFCKSQCMLFSDPVHWPRIHVVRCTTGPNFERIEPTPLPEAARFLFVGRLCAEKGLTVLIDAFAQAQQSGVPMQLAIVGDGPMRAETEAKIREHGMADKVSLLGWQNAEAIQRELRACRTFVLPSFAEGLPVVIMEAFQMGRPVISTQIAGIPELVKHGINGWLVAPGDASQLAQAIIEAASTPLPTLAAMGTAAVASVKLKHDFNQQLSSLESLLTLHRHQASR